ncbi:protein of unknown function [bacterium A37T11]|nr:protein of unknown function [bacterium A37T11]
MKTHGFNTLAYIALLLSGLALGCSKDNDENTGDVSIDAPAGGTVTIEETAYASGAHEGSAETGADENDLLSNSTFSKTVNITFGDAVTISNAFANNGVSITQSGQDITITSTIKEVEYVLTGTTSNGSVKIYSDNKFRLTLNGVSITNNDGPAINIQSGKSAFIVLAAGTQNSLSDGTTYASAPDGEDQKSTLFGEGQLLFSGTGSLTVAGNNNHAIASDDYIRVSEGTITVSNAVKDGIHCNDYFIADGGTISITAKSDGIEADQGHIILNDGTITVNAADDGIAASYNEGDASIDPYIVVNGGTINITTTKGEGIESKSILTINNGDISTNTADDGINAGKAIYINGGTVYAKSSGNDAMDSNGTFTITGGLVIGIGSGREDGIDCDGNTLKISGGLVLGTGGSTSGPSSTESTVRSLIAGGANAGQIIHIEDKDGKEVLTFNIPVSFNTLLYASPRLLANTTYNIYLGGSVTNGTEVHGLYTKGTYTRGTASAQFTSSAVVTQIGGNIMRM